MSGEAHKTVFLLDQGEPPYTSTRWSGDGPPSQ